MFVSLLLFILFYFIHSFIHSSYNLFDIILFYSLIHQQSRQKPQPLESMPHYDGFEKATPEEIAKQLTLYEMDYFRMLGILLIHLYVPYLLIYI